MWCAQGRKHQRCSSKPWQCRHRSCAVSRHAGRIGAAIREDFIPNEARFMGITLGDEASDAVAHTSPMGDATISYRTTKVA